LLLAACLAAGAQAADEEGCLLCHTLPLVRASAQGARVLAVRDASDAVHAGLLCSDCHRDARAAPHPAPPGPATCLGSCHGPAGDAEPAHRRASFGGLTESHRAAAAPRSPCVACHRFGDAPGDAGALGARCASCHPSQAAAGAIPAHGRTVGGRTAGCPLCHRAHREASGAGEVRRAACDGTGCHGNVTQKMRRLAGHEDRRRAGSAADPAAALVFAGLAVGGFALGRVLDAGTEGGGP